MAGAAPVQQPDQPRWLRVVHDHEVPVARKDAGVRLQGRQVEAAVAGRQVDVHPLQAVVQLLGEVEEVVASGEDVPLGFQSQPALERNERGKQLGHTAPVGRRIDMEHSGAPERSGQLLDRADRLLTYQAGVVL